MGRLVLVGQGDYREVLKQANRPRASRTRVLICGTCGVVLEISAALGPKVSRRRAILYCVGASCYHVTNSVVSRMAEMLLG